eukprot:TRINITY_DN152_c0_g1_i1.p1 TRINITY_DN152_c0_g1~~TRINITY_DN152_c0_g1_i1.p1  ORF type:complete len:309 (-),score=79.69 TRINITY_DN152_c0_g1_i1:77-1003(-)
MSRTQRSFEEGQGSLEGEGIVSLRRGRRRKQIDGDFCFHPAESEGASRTIAAASSHGGVDSDEDIENVIDISSDDEVEFVCESDHEEEHIERQAQEEEEEEEEEVVFVSESIQSRQGPPSLPRPRHSPIPIHNFPVQRPFDHSLHWSVWDDDDEGGDGFLHQFLLQPLPSHQASPVSGGFFVSRFLHEPGLFPTLFQRGEESARPKACWKDIKRPRRVRETSFSKYRSTKGLTPTRRSRRKGVEQKNDEIADADLPSTCPCCLEEFEDDDQIWILPCDRKHIFHPQCIKQWLVEGRHTCPVCRGTMMQ